MNDEDDNFRTIGQIVEEILLALTIIPTAQVIPFPLRDKACGNFNIIPEGLTE